MGYCALSSPCAKVSTYKISWRYGSGNIPKARPEISPEKKKKKKKKKKKLEKNFFLSGILYAIFFSDSTLDMKLILFFLDSSRHGGKISLRGHPSRVFSFLVIYCF